MIFTVVDSVEFCFIFSAIVVYYRIKLRYKYPDELIELRIYEFKNKVHAKVRPKMSNWHLCSEVHFLIYEHYSMFLNASWYKDIDKG